jgi:hypothetical protein
MHTPDVPLSPKPTTVKEVAVPSLPTSFPLTLAASVEEGSEEEGLPCLIELQWDKHPPVSSGMAASILTLNPLLTLDPRVSATVWATAYGLISTIHNRTAEFAQKLENAERKVARLKAVNQQQVADIQQLRA